MVSPEAVSQPSRAAAASTVAAVESFAVHRASPLKTPNSGTQPRGSDRRAKAEILRQRRGIVIVRSHSSGQRPSLRTGMRRANPNPYSGQFASISRQ